MQNQIDTRFYRELRCPSCHLLICREYIFDGHIEFKCGRCGELTTFRFRHNASAKIAVNEAELLSTKSREKFGSSKPNIAKPPGLSARNTKGDMC
jgi:phage FluMu protein Com